MLLEVILALALFAAAAAIISSGISAAFEGVERQKRNAHALDLAISLLSEIKMGLRTLESTGPEPFESPFDAWTWELVLAGTETAAGEATDLTQVEAVIRHPESEFVFRLAETLKTESPGGSSLSPSDAFDL